MKNLLLTAMQYYGLAEVPGTGSNPIILSWIKRLFPNHNDDSTISWCSVFIHQVAYESGHTIPIAPNSGLARSWLSYGVTINLNLAEPGDIVVLWRGSLESWQGHVSLYVNEWSGGIRLLGGNQENAVNIRTYPKSRVIGVRRLG